MHNEGFGTPVQSHTRTSCFDLRATSDTKPPRGLIEGKVVLTAVASQLDLFQQMVS
jgi:hypothetical protein